VLEVLTGQREMDASAIVDYFAPLKTWLDEQNKGRKIGW
jgi:peptidyl-dipeptidase A